MRKSTGAPLLAGALLVVLVACLASAMPTSAEVLRWELAEGDELYVRIVKKTVASATAGAAMDMIVEQRMDLRWKVVEVGDDGSALIEQAFERIRTNMTSPLGEIEYDTEEEPAGLAALAGPGLKVLTEHPLSFIFTPRGEITSVEIPEEVLEGLKNGTGVAALGGMLSEEGFRTMMSQGLITLPEEAPEEGTEWSESVNVDNPQFGQQTVTTSYRFEGDREQDGKVLATFAPQLSISFAGESPVPVSIVAQDSSGEVQFNRTAGRLEMSRIDHELVLEIRVGEQPIEQRLDQTISIEFSDEAPAEAIPEDTKEQSAAASE